MNVNIQVSPVTGSNGEYMHQVEVVADGYEPVFTLAKFAVPCSFEKAHKCGEEIRAAFYRAQVEKKPLSIVPANGVLEVVPDDANEEINKAAYAAGYRVREKLFDEAIVENIRFSSRDKILVAEKEAAQSLMKRWRWAAYLGVISFWVMLFMPSIVRAVFSKGVFPICLF